MAAFYIVLWHLPVILGSLLFKDADCVSLLKKCISDILFIGKYDLRIYDGKCPTLRAQRDGVLYVRDGIIYQLTGYEALLLQGFPKENADNALAA